MCCSAAQCISSISKCTALRNRSWKMVSHWFFTKIKHWDSFHWLTSTWVCISCISFHYKQLQEYILQLFVWHTLQTICNTPILWWVRAEEPSLSPTRWWWAGCRLPTEGSREQAGIPRVLHAKHSTALVHNKPPNTGPKEVLIWFWRKRPQLMNISHIHRFPLSRNFEGGLIIWSFETKSSWRTKLD